MAILVTRPMPDNERTAAALQARGYQVILSPMLRFEAFAAEDDDAVCDAAILTSANTVRALADHPALARLAVLPAFAVGDHTADVARDHGFRNVTSASGDASSLRDLILRGVAAKTLKKDATLWYLAGADLARDLVGELGRDGFTVIKQVVYRMTPVEAFSADVSEALASGSVEAVLHYSARSARAFITAARMAGVEVSALALPHICISDAVAAVLREAGASQASAAIAPDETSLLNALDSLKKKSR